MQTLSEKKYYRYFIKQLKNNAYKQLQRSIYIKYIRDYASFKFELILLERISPDYGNIIVICQTYAKFNKTKIIRGEMINIEQMRARTIYIND
jgi:CRISPR-associated endonuclease Cas2